MESLHHELNKIDPREKRVHQRLDLLESLEKSKGSWDLETREEMVNTVMRNSV